MRRLEKASDAKRVPDAHNEVPTRNTPKAMVGMSDVSSIRNAPAPYARNVANSVEIVANPVKNDKGVNIVEHITRTGQRREVSGTNSILSSWHRLN